MNKRKAKKIKHPAILGACRRCGLARSGKDFDHCVDHYADAVLSSRIIAGRLVKLACKRHLEDRKGALPRGLHFDETAATDAIEFFPFLRLDGDPKKPFHLLPWQIFTIGSIFGWKNADNTRRFRTAYIETGKGSGKTPLAAGTGDYGLFADFEWGAEIYFAAVTRDQAGIGFRDAKRMVEANPELADQLDIGTHNVTYKETQSFLTAISSEARSLDGKRVHMAIVDELHEHRTAEVVDKVDLGKKSRLQPLTFEITNAGSDQHSVCHEHREYTRAILEKRIQDGTWFGYVCQLDPCANCSRAGKLAPVDECKDCDHWWDERVWLKTNPSLEIGLPHMDYLREQVRQARLMPSKQNRVKRFNFCIWTEQETRWIDMELWAQGATPLVPGDLLGRPCFVGLDLSSNRDLTAEAKVFPPVSEGEPWKVLMRFWIPEDNVEARVDDDGIPYDVWIREGYIETTPGNVVDKDYIEQAILADAAAYRIMRVGYDRFFADQLVQHLEMARPDYVPDIVVDPLTDRAQKQWCIPIGMGFGLALASKEFERLLLAKLIQHGDNPVLKWMAGNVSIKIDAHGNFWPIKVDDKKRVDGIVALITALARAVVEPKDAGGTSIYDTRGPISLRVPPPG